MLITRTNKVPSSSAPFPYKRRRSAKFPFVPPLLSSPSFSNSPIFPPDHLYNNGFLLSVPFSGHQNRHHIVFRAPSKSISTTVWLSRKLNWITELHFLNHFDFFSLFSCHNIVRVCCLSCLFVMAILHDTYKFVISNFQMVSVLVEFNELRIGVLICRWRLKKDLDLRGWGFYQLLMYVIRTQSYIVYFCNIFSSLTFFFFFYLILMA